MISKDRDGKVQNGKPHERPREPQKALFDSGLPVIVIVYSIVRVMGTFGGLFLDVFSYCG